MRGNDYNTTTIRNSVDWVYMQNTWVDWVNMQNLLIVFSVDLWKKEKAPRNKHSDLKKILKFYCEWSLKHLNAYQELTCS